MKLVTPVELLDRLAWAGALNASLDSRAKDQSRPINCRRFVYIRPTPRTISSSS